MCWEHPSRQLILQQHSYREDTFALTSGCAPLGPLAAAECEGRNFTALSQSLDMLQRQRLARKPVIQQEIADLQAKPDNWFESQTMTATELGSTSQLLKKWRIDLFPQHLTVKLVRNLNDAQLPPGVMAGFGKLGLGEPAPIQSVCWPVMLQRRDVIVNVLTTTTTILAYAIPALSYINDRKTQEDVGKAAPTVIVLQILMPVRREIHDIFQNFGVSSVLLSRSNPKALDKSVDVVIAHPLDVMAAVSDGSLDASGVSFVVIDQAHRLVQEKDAAEPAMDLFNHIKRNYHAAVFTVPKNMFQSKIDRLTTAILSTPVKISKTDEMHGPQFGDETMGEEADMEQELGLTPSQTI